MQHRRRSTNVKKRLVRGLIFRNSRSDLRRGETVSLITREEILRVIQQLDIEIYSVPDVEKGEILVDARGKGSLQQAAQVKTSNQQN